MLIVATDLLVSTAPTKSRRMHRSFQEPSGQRVYWKDSGVPTVGKALSGGLRGFVRTAIWLHGI